MKTILLFLALTAYSPTGFSLSRVYVGDYNHQPCSVEITVTKTDSVNLVSAKMEGYQTSRSSGNLWKFESGIRRDLSEVSEKIMPTNIKLNALNFGIKNINLAEYGEVVQAISLSGSLESPTSIDFHEYHHMLYVLGKLDHFRCERLQLKQ